MNTSDYRELIENMIIGGVGFIVGAISTYIVGRAKGYKLKAQSSRRSFS